LPLLVMIAVTVGFGLFPMHLYDVVRSGVNPLIAKITQVVPVAQTGEESGVRGAVKAAVRPPEVPLVVNNALPLTPDPSRRLE